MAHFPREPLNILGLFAYFVALLIAMAFCYSRPCPAWRRVVSVCVVAVTWFLILRYTINYEGLNVFDEAYADVVWGGSEGNWGISQMLLTWAIVVNLWTVEASPWYQVFGVLGAMSGSWWLYVPQFHRQQTSADTVPGSYAIGSMIGFVCVWLLPYSKTVAQLSWLLWGLHVGVLLPKFVSFGPAVNRGLLSALVSIFALATHLSATSSPLPATDCQISISIDTVIASGLTLLWIYEHSSSAPTVCMWAVALPIISPASVLGAYTAIEYGAPSTLVTKGQRVVAEWRRTVTANCAPPKRWVNLGYWKDTRVYDKACEHLASLVGDAAKLQSGDKVLCVGCGSADDLMLFREKFQVGHLVGIDARLPTGATESLETADVKLLQMRAEEIASGSKGFSAGEFNKILAVDSLYHFDKARFFSDSARLLAKGDVVAFTDVVVTPEAPWWVKAALSAMDIRPANHWSASAYSTKLSESGFHMKSLTSLEPYVMQGGGWLPAALLRYLDYVLIVAELEAPVHRPKAAVVGSGLSGLVAAHLLDRTHDVTIYEAGPVVGMAGLQQKVDAGVTIDIPLRLMLPQYYDRMVQLVSDLGLSLRNVPYNACYLEGDQVLLCTSTSWAAHIFQHLKYIPYIAKFMYVAFFKAILPDETFGEYIARHGLGDSEAFRIYSTHLSWILSCPYETVNSTPASIIMGFVLPANPLVRMWQSAGNIVRLHPSNAVLQDALLVGKKIKVGHRVEPFGKDRIIDGVAYDVVILATEAPAAAKLVPDDWPRVFEKVKYVAGNILVHKDSSLMPSDRADWRTFNVRSDAPDGACQLTVWLNSYWDRFDLKEDLFETWNAVHSPPSPDLVIKDIRLQRSSFTKDTFKVWEEIRQLQGRDGIYICGAYSIEGMGLLEQATRAAECAVEAVHRDMKKNSDAAAA
eukprot:TRINITY_DN25607_c0_g4_i1.p1 TRINITY_DN25607_c0_g4~~TRINITY_DN25607_c0_g4_i1.p1  ORF type:complete len:919 (+),score=80.64 TRINITY_DN25607_c0_g4_i1:89-2845(+)